MLKIKKNSIRSKELDRFHSKLDDTEEKTQKRDKQSQKASKQKVKGKKEYLGFILIFGKTNTII